MDIRITLIGLMMLVTSIAFGQKAVINYENNFKTGVGKPLIAYTQDFSNSHQGVSSQTDKTIQEKLRSKLSIDSRLRFDSAVWYLLDTTQNQWVYDWKYKQEYDALGNEILFASYTWDKTKEVWFGNLKREYEYEYSATGKKRIIFGYEWDKTNDDWIKSYKSESMYDINGKEILGVGYNWDDYTKTWINSDKYEPEYDAKGYKIFAKSYDWDFETGQWIFTTKDEFEYNANGDMTLFISYFWNRGNNTWRNGWKSEFFYDSQGNNILYLGYSWDDTIGQWIANGKTEFKYDSIGNETLYCQYYWGETTNQWEGGYKGDYGYTTNGEITNNYTYDWCEATNDWQISPSMKAIYYYEGQNFSSANRMETEKIRVYPNPATEYLSYSFDDNNNPITFELFDLQGNSIIFKKVNAADKISVKGIKSGIYLYNFNIGTKRQTGKLIIE